MKVINLAIIFLLAVSVAFANEKLLQVSDDGWLKAEHSLCQKQYGFDPEIASNCYKNKKMKKFIL